MTSINTMKQAIEALNEAVAFREGGRQKAIDAINALRTAIQQAESDRTGLRYYKNDACKAASADSVDCICWTPKQAAESEPVAWVVMNGISKYQVCGAKAQADALCSEMQKRHDLSGSLAAFHVQPLYTHPAPGVPDDSKRLDYLQDRGATIDLVPGVAGFYPMRFRVGGLHSSASIDVRAAIDAAMLAAYPAQKGGE